jgi:leucyl-tRNA synthetase
VHRLTDFLRERADLILLLFLAALMLATMHSYGVSADAGVQHRWGRRLVRWYATLGHEPRVTDDLGRRHQFNTPISAVMELVNDLVKAPSDPSAPFAAETAVSLLQPWAPHITEELWETLGHERLWEEPWPVADPAMLEEDTFELVVQVNGRVRDRLLVPVDLPEDELVARAKESPKVQAHLDGGEIRQTIVVPRKLVNLVVG